MIRSPKTEHGIVERARILLLAAEGRSTRSIAVELGTTRPGRVSRWRAVVRAHSRRDAPCRGRLRRQGGGAHCAQERRHREPSRQNQELALNAAGPSPASCAAATSIIDGCQISDLRRHRQLHLIIIGDASGQCREPAERRLLPFDVAARSHQEDQDSEECLRGGVRHCDRTVPIDRMCATAVGRGTLGHTNGMHKRAFYGPF